MADDEKVTIKSADMPEDIQANALQLIAEAVEKYKVESDAASYIKKEMDSKYGPTWHCVVGSSFGSYVTHLQGNFLYIDIDKLSVLLFKS